MKLIRIGGLLAILLAAGGALGAADAKAPKAGATAGIKDTVEVPPEIEGVEIARPDGTFLGLQIVNNRFVLSFYDAKKKKQAADRALATMRWPVKYQPNDERAVLNPAGDGTALSSNFVVRPPHNFKVYISLFVEGNETAVESYHVDVRG